MSQWAIADGQLSPEPSYDPIEMPLNTPIGFILAFFVSIAGFALIWHITWMAILGLVCATGTLLVFGWIERIDEEISGDDLAIAERSRSKASAG